MQLVRRSHCSGDTPACLQGAHTGAQTTTDALELLRELDRSRGSIEFLPIIHRVHATKPGEHFEKVPGVRALDDVNAGFELNWTKLKG